MKHLLRLLFFVFAAMTLSSTLAHAYYEVANAIHIDYNDDNSVVIKGDVNGDGEVTIADVNAIIDIILGGTVNEDALNGADVNEDGEVTIADINSVIDIILGGGPTPNPDTMTFTVNGVVFKMVAVNSGTFTMGATSDQGATASSNEYPTHQVTLSDYFIGQTEVTQELWQAVMGSNPSNHTGDLQRPVECVSWDDCQTFVSKLNELTGKQFRLPTEAEWEYAARGGDMSKGYKYSGGNSIGKISWYSDNSGNVTHAVAKKTPNELGLYDMSGNVFEWCEDWFDSYPNEPQNDPTGPESGQFRVLRGGCYESSAENCRVSCRNYSQSAYHGDNLGLRLAFTRGYTAVPVISTQQSDSSVIITADGDGVVTLYVNGQAVTNPYVANRGEVDYTITVYATAQEVGLNMSQSEMMSITIPAMEFTAVPVISTETNEYAVTISAEGDGTVTLYVNDQAVSNPYIASRSNTAYTIKAYATAKEEGKVMSQCEPKNIIVPALEYTQTPVITTQMDDSTMTISATGVGIVTLYVNGQAVSNPHTVLRSNSSYTITAYATAKENGKVMSQSETINIIVPAIEYTAIPTITTQTNESEVTLTAIGEGVVTLYVNGSAVSNPYAALRGNTDYKITAYATAKEDGKILSKSETLDITIPALIIDPNITSITVNGVSFNMIRVQGGTFMMGGTAGQGDQTYDDEFPSHEVTLSSYSIGETEVTQALWQAVMGTNPSGFVGNLNRPVETVSWNDCQAFIAKLNQMTGKSFRLPTEAEWEYAARGGNKGHDYMFAGSNDLDDVAWAYSNIPSQQPNSDGYGTQPVAQKAPNDLGLYDMSGNVYEWCSDWYDAYPAEAQINPKGPSDDEGCHYRVNRGGGWNRYGRSCRVSLRNNSTPESAYFNIGMRLVLDVNEIYTVNGVSFTMVPVEGGTFIMGATPEQGTSDPWTVEYPTHEVTLSSFSIGQTEVTQELWQAVMGNNPSEFSGDTNHPVEMVSWDDCQTFITQLNTLTGMNFRLPTEAEWEYAARGGSKSHGFKYAGGNDINELAWWNDNACDGVGPDSSDYGTHPVASKKANELGLYDMSGNVWEWCQDWFGNYSDEAQTNPIGPTTGDNRVYRGGSWINYARNCRVSSRFHWGMTGANNIGLRLAM